MREQVKLSAWLDLPIKSLLLAVILFTASAVLLNYFRLPLFFGIEFIFGSSIAVLAIVLLGTKAALIVGFLAAAVTLFIWGHPYACLVFTLEIIWLNWRWRMGNGANLVLQDLLFWLLAGIPMIMVFYTLALDSDWHTAAIVGLKQMTNGIFNTLLACIVLVLMQLQQRVATRLALPVISLRQVLFYTLMALTLFSGSVPLILDAKKLQAEYELSIDNRLALLAELLHHKMQTTAVVHTSTAPAFQTLMQELALDDDTALALLDRQGRVLHAIGPMQSFDRSLERIPMPGASKWTPSGITLRLHQWRDSRYLYVKPVTTADNIAFIAIEQGAADIVKKLQQDSVRQLLLLVGFVLLTMMVSSVLSKAISAPLKHLAIASKRIKDDIASGGLSIMPQSNVAEYSSLSTSLLKMSNDLAQQFSLSKATQSDLAKQVMDSTIALRQSNNQLEAILAAASGFSIIATNAEGVITYFSFGAEKLLGYQAAELVNIHTPAILHLGSEVQQRAEQLSAELNQAIEGFQAFVIIADQKGSESREWHYVRKDGQTVLVQLTVTPIKDGDGTVSGYLGIAKDISERHRNEKLKNEFISTVSHELRTPLTSIYGSLRMVNSGMLAVLPPKVSKLLQVAEANSQRLTVLINDLLDMEKLLAGKIQLVFQQHAVAPLIEEAMQAISSYAEQYQVSLVAELPDDALYANLDAARFIQILQNLLSNAIKFSAAGAKVVIRLYQQQNTIKLDVVDHGAGIAEAFKMRVFERFSQSDSDSTRQHGGTGLGLAISKELTEQMGGCIGFESAVGKGSTFWLVFPNA